MRAADRLICKPTQRPSWSQVAGKPRQWQEAGDRRCASWAAAARRTSAPVFKMTDEANGMAGGRDVR